jgi:hypothetical protein
MNARQRLWLKAKQTYGGLVCEFIKQTFPLWERLGVHLTMNHYDEPVPDTRRLRETLWSRPSELAGLDMREQEQLALLTRLAARFKGEYDRFPVDAPPTPHAFCLNNGGFPGVDAEILYGMIREFKPRRIIEIGSGNSTYLSAQAILKNQEDDPRCACELIAIEPYPNAVLQAGFPGLSRLNPRPVQDVPLDEFKRLEASDILFIDSSHVLKIGSDVHYEYLEILPRLPVGVLVHIHDIFFPAEYPKDLVLGSRRFWTEQYLVQAFLAFNESFKIFWAGNYLHVTHPDALAAAFGSYDRAGRWPGSLWIQRVK